MTSSGQATETANKYQRLTDEEMNDLLMTVPHWILKGGNVIEREFMCKDFRDAINLVCKIADIAEKIDHHPEMCIYFNKVQVRLSTHKAGGLTHMDFDMAAQIDKAA